MAKVGTGEANTTNDATTTATVTAPVPEASKKDKDKAATTDKPETSVQTMALPEVVGLITCRILTALQTDDAAFKQAELSGCRRDLRLWYEAQPVADRKEGAKRARKTAENFKMVSEQVYSDIVSLAMQDL